MEGPHMLTFWHANTISQPYSMQEEIPLVLEYEFILFVWFLIWYKVQYSSLEINLTFFNLQLPEFVVWFCFFVCWLTKFSVRNDFWNISQSFFDCFISRFISFNIYTGWNPYKNDIVAVTYYLIIDINNFQSYSYSSDWNF